MDALRETDELISKRQFKTAADIMLAALEQDPRNPMFLERAGMCLIYSGRTLKAVELLQEAVEIAPSLPTSWQLLGTGYAQTGKHDLAIECLRHHLALSPSSLDGQIHLAELLVNNAQDTAEAEALLQQALTSLPADDPRRRQVDQLLRRCSAENDR